MQQRSAIVLSMAIMHTFVLMNEAYMPQQMLGLRNTVRRDHLSHSLRIGLKHDEKSLVVHD